MNARLLMMIKLSAKKSEMAGEGGGRRRDDEIHLVEVFGEGHAGGKAEGGGGDVFGGLVRRFLVILEAVQVLVSFGAFLAAVFFLLDDGIVEASVQGGQCGTAGDGRGWGGDARGGGWCRRSRRAVSEVCVGQVVLVAYAVHPVVL